MQKLIKIPKKREVNGTIFEWDRYGQAERFYTDFLGDVNIRKNSQTGGKIVEKRVVANGLMDMKKLILPFNDEPTPLCRYHRWRRRQQVLAGKPFQLSQAVP
jgi:hypothetical protein